MVKFEGQERRMPKIEACLKEYGMSTLEEARAVTGRMEKFLELKHR